MYIVDIYVCLFVWFFCWVCSVYKFNNSVPLDPEVEFWFSGFGFGFRCALLWILIDLIVYLADMVCLFVCLWGWCLALNRMYGNINNNQQ